MTRLAIRIGTAALLIVGFAIGGCVTYVLQRTLQMTYHSDPEGATLYEGAKLWGYTPVTLTYPAAKTAFYHHQCIRLNPAQVHWVSGATASINNLQACPSSGSVQHFVFVRPASVPGADVDANFAVQIQRNGIMQQQAEAMRDAADAASALAIINATAPHPPPKTFECDSRVIHDTLQTSCQ